MTELGKRKCNFENIGEVLKHNFFPGNRPRLLDTQKPNIVPSWLSSSGSAADYRVNSIDHVHFPPSENFFEYHKSVISLCHLEEQRGGEWKMGGADMCLSKDTLEFGTEVSANAQAGQGVICVSKDTVGLETEVSANEQGGEGGMCVSKDTLEFGTEVSANELAGEGGMCVSKDTLEFGTEVSANEPAAEGGMCVSKDTLEFGTEVSANEAAAEGGMCVRDEKGGFGGKISFNDGKGGLQDNPGDSTELYQESKVLYNDTESELDEEENKMLHSKQPPPRAFADGIQFHTPNTTLKEMSLTDEQRELYKVKNPDLASTYGDSPKIFDRYPVRPGTVGVLLDQPDAGLIILRDARSKDEFIEKLHAYVHEQFDWLTTKVSSGFNVVFPSIPANGQCNLGMGIAQKQWSRQGFTDQQYADFIALLHLRVHTLKCFGNTKSTPAVVTDLLPNFGITEVQPLANPIRMTLWVWGANIWNALSMGGGCGQADLIAKGKVYQGPDPIGYVVGIVTTPKDANLSGIVNEHKANEEAGGGLVMREQQEKTKLFVYAQEPGEGGEGGEGPASKENENSLRDNVNNTQDIGYADNSGADTTTYAAINKHLLRDFSTSSIVNKHEPKNGTIPTLGRAKYYEEIFGSDIPCIGAAMGGSNNKVQQTVRFLCEL